MSHERPLDPDGGDLFRLLVASVRDYAIFMLDPGGHVVTWNAGAERFKGYTAPEILGRHFSVFYPASPERESTCELELEIATRDGVFEDEGWRMRKDGSRFWANVVITAVRDDAGTLVGFAKVTRDLTERKRSEDDRAARLAAEHANRTKDEFLAILGHELRNPLAPIVTALQLINLRGETTMPRELQIIERQVLHMTRLVDDLLDVSGIARGKVELRKTVVDLAEVAGRALEIAGPLFEQRSQQVDVDAPPQPILVEGDEGRLVQVLANLLTNAAKYSGPGSRTHVALHRTADDAIVEVRDEGRGIEPELLPHVFDMFVQSPRAVDRSVGGLGLGLALVRSLVTLHGGTVQAQSPGPGGGSTFTVRLPALPTPAAATGASGRPSATVLPAPDRRRVLVVDDNHDACFLLSQLLLASGHEVQTAYDGAEALRRLADFSPDVAVLDIGLPVMDGYELAQRIRVLLPRGVRLIALSGYGAPRDRERSRLAGFDQHLVKPVDTRELLDALTRTAAPERG